MSFQRQLHFPVKKRSSSEKCANPKKLSPKRVLFENTSPLISPSKKCKQDENSENVDFSYKTKKKTSISSPFAVAKQVFHTGQSANLVGRSKEIEEIDKFIRDHVDNHESGSMYISGAPGTGKTTCLMSVLKSWENKLSHAFVNCMSVSNPSDIYKSITREFKMPSKVVNSKKIIKDLEEYITTSKKMNVLILDEIDHLDSKSQEVLYSLFGWPQLHSSTLILIGIANALDLTDRMLPRLQIFMCNPKLLHFQPYTKDQITSILEDRLSKLQGKTIIKPLAIQLCARKISACTGDIRKALDVCRRAIEVVENKRQKCVLQSTSDDRLNPGSPSKKSLELCVDIPDISAVLHEIYGSRLQTSEASKTVTMPLQQMIILCSLILMKKSCKPQDLNLGKLHDVYKRVCRKRDITAVPEPEFYGLCRLIETRGFIVLKPSKVIRMTKLVLKIDEGEAEFLFQDKVMLPAILSDTSVLTSS